MQSLAWWHCGRGLRVIPSEAEHESKHEINKVGHTQLQGKDEYKYGLRVCWIENYQQPKDHKSTVYQNINKFKPIHLTCPFPPNSKV